MECVFKLAPKIHPYLAMLLESIVYVYRFVKQVNLEINLLAVEDFVEEHAQQIGLHKMIL
jgi:hypothetical protein